MLDKKKIKLCIFMENNFLPLIAFQDSSELLVTITSGSFICRYLFYVLCGNKGSFTVFLVTRRPRYVYWRYSWNVLIPGVCFTSFSKPGAISFLYTSNPNPGGTHKVVNFTEKGTEIFILFVKFKQPFHPNLKNSLWIKVWVNIAPLPHTNFFISFQSS